MNHLHNKKFFILMFAMTPDEFIDKSKNTHISLNCPAIIEVAAVEIKNRKIQGHFHSFISIEDYNACNIDFEDGLFQTEFVTPQHLIGAPSFSAVADRLYSYIQGGTLIICSSWKNPFSIFKDKAESIGRFFNNPVIELQNVLTAARLKNAITKNDISFENANILTIAGLLADNSISWQDVFDDYNICFNPNSDDDYNKDRNDPLSWALAFAQLFIALISTETPVLQELDTDEKYPF